MGPPRRPDLAGSGVRDEHRWLPVTIVALVILVVVAGGYVTAGALSAGGAGARTVGGAVTVRPAAGWVFAGDPAGEGTAARFTSGSSTLDVFTGATTGDARALAQAYVDRSLEPNSSRLTASSPTEWRALRLDGITGIRLAYIGVFDQSGVPIEGQVTAVVTARSAGVVFDGWAPQGQLRFAVDDIDGMIGSATFP